MTGRSSIEWTEATWNPVVGCSIVSPGCTNCYAMKMAARIEKMREAARPNGAWLGPMTHYAGTTKKVNGNAVWTGKVARAPETILVQPLRRKKPTTYFVNSMGDLFHEDVPDKWIDEVFAVMALTPQHTYQVLTKRAARMQSYLANVAADYDEFALFEWADAGGRLCQDGDGGFTQIMNAGWPLPNVWLGVSTERQQEADERIPLLLQTPAAVRFISAEPLLGPIELWNIDEGALRGCAVIEDGHVTPSTPDNPPEGVDTSYPGLDWVIAGGESGPGARPMHPDWARGLRDQCAAANVPFFFKQWGGARPKSGGRQLDAREWSEMPARGCL